MTTALSTRDRIFKRETMPDIEHVNAAYRLAGLPVPNTDAAIDHLVFGQPTVEQVAYDLAMAALTTTNPDNAYADALRKINEAQAADTLRDAYTRASEAAHREKLPAIRDKAAHDLAKALTKTAETISKAAAKLGTDAPFDLDNAVALDATREYKQLIAAIGQLGVYASVHYVRMRPNLPGALAAILPIIAIPDVEIEIVERGAYGVVNRTINRNETHGTRAVRKLADDLDRDTDTALMNVALGKYAGISYQLATTAELEHRADEAARAFIQTDKR
jgi:hypothetical protein